MSKLKDYIKLIRVKHYIKNFLIFVPLVFSGNLTEINDLLKTTLAFLAFCFIASSVYVINDIHDREKDKLHEIKRKRPIANGHVTLFEAYAIIFLFLFLALLCTYFCNNYTILYLLIYLLINLLYTFGLKNIPLVDVTILVIGYLIRVLMGATVIGVVISNWLYLTVMAISFYLALGKRRNEIIMSKKGTREVLKHYTQDFLDKNMNFCLVLTIVFYSLWTVDENVLNRIGQYLTWTVPLVILICMKYSMDVEGDSHGDPIEVIFKDKSLIILGFFYSIIILGLIYI